MIYQILVVLDCVLIQELSGDIWNFFGLVSPANDHIPTGGLVIRIPGYRPRGPEFDSRRYQIL
jgi:hypothetical protein